MSHQKKILEANPCFISSILSLIGGLQYFRLLQGPQQEPRTMKMVEDLGDTGLMSFTVSQLDQQLVLHLEAELYVRSLSGVD